MEAPTLTHWQLLADGVLGLHFMLVLFVLGMALAVPPGVALGWRWVRAPLLRWLHLLAITVVVAQSWLEAVCPLTQLENWLRQQARLTSYEKSFVEHWVQELLYYNLPPWVFVLAYTLFGVYVLWLWRRWPPRSRRAGRKKT